MRNEPRRGLYIEETIPMQKSAYQRTPFWVVISLLASLVGTPATASVIYNGVAAGDMSSSDAILWTRADNGGLTTALTAQVSTDPTFATGVKTITGTTNAAADFTLKLNATSLTPNTQYYYRFTDGTTTSPVGSFTTPAPANQATEVRFGFSGDADGRFRPYTLVNGFGTGTQPQSQHLTFFTFLGDTMYETASTGSPAVTNLTSTSNAATIAQGLADYQRKYRENVQGVNTSTGSPNQTSGQQSLQNLLAAAGSYTVLDNHELGNASLQSGGAPLAAGARVTPGQGSDVNTTGVFDNQTNAFKTAQKAFFDYHPTRAGLDANLNSTGPVVVAPGDPRLGTPGGVDDVTSDRRLNPNRAMLGATQLAWAKQTLLDAQNAGTPWKFVVISTPIDQTGPAQDGKSWFGGYMAERNDLLKFIADHKIQNVVFLTTDDHLVRMTALNYFTDLNDPSTARLVPGAFQIVTRPIGAGGPDLITDLVGDQLRTYRADRPR